MKKSDALNYSALMRSAECGIIDENIEQKSNSIVAIACSTGGPKALQAVIPVLPKGIKAPILIVQHMPEGFTGSLAERLNAMSDVTVKEADEGEELRCGCAYIARGGRHMEVLKAPGGKTVITYQDMPLREGVRPCANYMFESLAKVPYENIVCVVMTGMGADGREGIQALRKKKQIKVITQDQESSVIYGMPRCVAEAGLSDHVVPLEKIASMIVSLTE